MTKKLPKILIGLSIAIFLLSIFHFLFFDKILAADLNFQPSYPWGEGEQPIGGLVSKFYIYALAIVGVVALGAIIYGGILYTVSSGSPSQQQEAKNWITGAIWGVVLLAGAVLLLRTINPELVKLTEPGDLIDKNITITSLTKNASTLLFIQEQGEIGSNKKFNSLEALDYLNGVASVKNPCTALLISGGSDCVQLNGIRQTTLDEIKNLSLEIGSSNVFITGATESRIHSSGQYSHENGYKVDLRLDDELTNYIEQKFQSAGYRTESNGSQSPVYINPSTGSVYTKEGNHWDISVIPKI
ncbi:MAG: hypothetical protein UU85_C0004G0109 [Candidatus Wolfebacteria bacterium GW2011_GWA2_42_10]|uniref:Uncharacterized protein n=2 Tax=Candidatus Wolfeibacteriota TaxID=1752735 RepID=A0A0G0XK99_9BACT|nr:MAG: hypothetical protein UU38_C0001G0170 [Candidatus Wolfebacteria bacterium GW2011_GWB1_41_12]KKS25350.1 MAG: hypothetical protein UU85_C0004G0109 [Candidatus Wolfebacteria bacterium GW2011_GWA2_42_10]KKT56789.1 MAG: hypothetical protein UW50_C0001G0358 [Candidatus Wolfebacteria bacterium GW2011_GWA1_44_24]